MKLSHQDLKRLSDAVKEKHKNFVVSNMNDSSLRMAVNEDSICDWHSHPGSDELFIVLEGELLVEFKDNVSFLLKPMETLTVPSGAIHRTTAKERTVNLCFESTNATTVI